MIHRVVNPQLAGIGAALSELGQQVLIADSGSRGLDLFEKQRHSIDLVLLDLTMPEMDGLEATEIVRARERDTKNHIPIVAMTAYAMKGDRERCLEAGMDDYVSKPVRVEELINALDRTPILN